MYIGYLESSHSTSSRRDFMASIFSLMLECLGARVGEAEAAISSGSGAAERSETVQLVKRVVRGRLKRRCGCGCVLARLAARESSLPPL